MWLRLWLSLRLVAYVVAMVENASVTMATLVLSMMSVNAAGGLWL